MDLITHYLKGCIIKFLSSKIITKRNLLNRNTQIFLNPFLIEYDKWYYFDWYN